MKQFLNISIALASAVVVGGAMTLVGSKYTLGHFEPEVPQTQEQTWQPAPGIPDTSTQLVTEFTITVVETDPKMIMQICGGPDILACAYSTGNACIIWVPSIREDGRSPSLSATGFGVLKDMAVWGHELAHCVGVDIHGTREGR